MSAGSSWDRARRVLGVRLDTIGDVLMTTPALRALKESAPGRHVTLLTSSAGAAVAPFVPELDDVIVYDAPWLKATAARADSRPEYEMADRLRRAGFEAAVIFTVYSQNPLPSAFLCHLADIPLRLAHCRENPYQLLTHWVPEPEPNSLLRHEVRRQLDLVATVGCRSDNQRLSFHVTDEALRRALRLLYQIGLNQEEPWAVIHPGASAASRRYAPEKFAEVARLLTEKVGLQLVFTGSEAERPLVKQIRTQAGVRSWSLAGRLGLGELGAVLALTPLLISNNTGPVHVAAAVGTPVVDLYALTNPQHTPWGVPCRVLSHDVSCKYCYKSVCPQGHHHCLELVAPEAVVAAARGLLDETGIHERRAAGFIPADRTAGVNPAARQVAQT
jgi:lipopolysaccharide heptosyltransferase II